MRHFSLLLMVIAVAAASCAPAGTGGTSRNRDVLTREEIRQTQAGNVYEVVQRLRPQWLRPRTAGFVGSGEISVYVDDVRFGTTESLQTVSAQTVEELRWIDAATATQRWGTGNASGAIAITTIGRG